MIQQKTKNEAIYVAKGIGIVLVVVGHFHVQAVEPAYWEGVRKIIYLFHMPLFMALSGYLLGAGRLFQNIGEYYSGTLRNKIRRLLFPYITISLLLLSVKIGAGFVAHLQYPVGGDFYKYILLNPMGGFSTLLWFLYALFVIFLIFPFLRLSIRSDILLLLTVTGLSYPQWPTVFCLDSAMHHLPFFTGGYLAARHDLFNAMRMRIALPIFLIIFVMGAFFKLQAISPGHVQQQTNALVAGYSGVMVCFLFSLIIVSNRHFSFLKITESLKTLGVYSSGVYLLHTLSMGPVRITLTHLTLLNSRYFLLGALVTCGAGLLVPIVVQKRIIDQVPLARKLILGAR